jgi:hypothetical protein
MLLKPYNKKNTPNQKAAQKQTSALQTVADNIYELPAEPFIVDIGKALKEAKTINLSEYCDSIEYIPLETRPDFYMGNITVNNSAIYNDHYIIKAHGAQDPRFSTSKAN